MKARVLLVLGIILTGEAARADAPVWRRDMFATPVASTSLSSVDMEIDPQGGIHLAVYDNGAYQPVDFDATFRFLFQGPAWGTMVPGHAIVRDNSTGEVATLRAEGLTLLLLDAFGQEKWRTSAFPGATIGAFGGGVVRHPSGDFIIEGEDDAIAGFRLARIHHATGQVLWVAQVGVPSFSMDMPPAIDPLGNLIVSGFSMAGNGTLLFYRLDQQGGAVLDQASVPFASWGCAGQFTGQAIATGAMGMTTDSSGNIYLVGEGTTSFSTGDDAMLLKFDSSFNAVYCQRHNLGPTSTVAERWYDAKIGTGGSIALTGRTDPSGSGDVIAGLADASGNLLWMTSIDPSGMGNDDLGGQAVRFDPSGNVVSASIVAPDPANPLDREVEIFVCDAAGNCGSLGRWNSDPVVRAYGVAVDGLGNIEVVGDHGSGSRMFLQRFSASGGYSGYFVGANPGVQGRRIKFNASNDLFVAGVTGLGTTNTWLVQKRSLGGAVAWQKTGPVATPATDLDIAPSGDVIVVGLDGYLAEYTSAGAVVRTGNLVIGAQEPAIVAHANGEITVGGAANPGVPGNALLTHLSSTFVKLWEIPQIWGGDEKVSKLVVDPTGSLYAAGCFNNTLGVAKIDPTAPGSIVWQTSYPSAALTDCALSLGVDADGNLLVVGRIGDVNRILRYHSSGTLLHDAPFAFPKNSFDTECPSQMWDTVVYGGGASAAILGDASTSRTHPFLLKWSLTSQSKPGPRRIAAGEGPGGSNSNTVRTYDGSGSSSGTFAAYAANKYGTNVAVGDINTTMGDEHLTGPGPGAVFGPQVRAFLSAGTSIGKVNFYAYGTLKYGVMVAGGGIDADGYDEILTGPGPGPVFGPQVRGWNFDGTTLTAIAKVNYYAYGTLKYGVNVNAGTIDNDSFREILTGPGPGGVFGPQVRGWNFDGASLSSIGKVNFNAFSTGALGCNVAAGDIEADGYDEIVAGRGPGSALAAEIATFDFDATSISAKGPSILITLTTKYGANVGSGDLASAGIDDLIGGVGDDPAGSGRLRVLRWIGSGYSQVDAADFVATPSMYGVNVALGQLD